MNPIKNYIKVNWMTWMAVGILLWAVLVNRFPSDYIVVGGDVSQTIDLKHNFQQLFWSYEGRMSLFYGMFYLLSLMGVNDTWQLSFYLAFFLFGSFFSFKLFIRLLFKDTPEKLSILLSLFYALNLYTLYNFTYSWGYCHYQWLYVYIPILTGLFIKFLKTDQYKWGMWFVFVLFFASAGFINPAFALGFGIYFLILSLLLLAFKDVYITASLLKKLGMITGLAILVNAYWLMPLSVQAHQGLSEIASGRLLSLDWWLQKTSNMIVDTLRLSQTNNYYFPDNFPYRTLYHYKFKGIFTLLTFLPMLLIIFSFVKIRKWTQKGKTYYIVFFGILLFFVMLVARVRPPFMIINKYIFTTSSLSVLRSYEKLAIFTPFMFAVLMLISAREIKSKIIQFAIILILLTPLPFYLGKLQQNMSAKFSGETVSNKNYQKVDYSFLVRIPNEYEIIKPILNSTGEDFYYAALPTSMTRSYGWAEYPKWKMVGDDVTRRLYNKQLISPDNFFFNDWLFAEEFGQEEQNSTWIVPLLGMMNAKYLIFHSDVDPKILKQTQPKIDYLKDNRYISLVQKNDFFQLYQIPEDYIFPFIRWQESDQEISVQPQIIEEQIKKQKQSITNADFEKVNPTYYRVKPLNNVSSSQLVMAVPFNPNWKAIAFLNSGKKIELKSHFKANGYANGWEINEKEDIKEIILQYWPMKLAYYGFMISGAALLFVIGFLYKIYERKNIAID